jgi:cell division protein FtsQ
MRQVNARASAAARPARPAGRSKPVARMPEARPELRGNGGIKLGLEAGMTRLEWLRGTFLVRHPILSLSLFIGLVGVVSGLIAGGYAGRAVASVENAVYGTMAEAGFAIHDIALTGNERTSDEEVRAAIGMKVGEPIFAADPAQARAALMRLPWVSDADVQRTLPDKIAVRVVEKRPFAMWRIGSGFAVVERSGAVIVKAEPAAFKHLPVLVGDGAPEAAAPLIDALAPDKAVNARLAAIARIGGRRWDLILSGGVTVRLPEEGWEAQLGELERLIVERGILERDIEMIDLRYPDNYVFRLHNGDSRPMPRERRA